MRVIYRRPNRFLHLDYLVNPLPALAIFVMALNDHYLKGRLPSWLTGKLSDFMGIFYFPLLVCGLYCLIGNYIFRFKREEILSIDRKKMTVASLLTVTLMVSVNIHQELTSFIEGTFSTYLFKIQLTTDPSDLWSLLVLPLSHAYARQFYSR